MVILVSGEHCGESCNVDIVGCLSTLCVYRGLRMSHRPCSNLFIKTFEI